MSASERIKKAIEISSIVYVGSKLDVAKGALNALGMVGEAVKPYVPLISVLKYDHECLEHDLAEMNEFMQQIKSGVDDNQKQLNMIYQEIVSIQTHMQQSERKSQNSMKINAPKIDPSQLQKPEPSEGNNQRPSHPRIIKRIYLRNATEVACKINDKTKKIPVCKGDEKDKEIQKEFVTIIKMAWQHDPEARINISKLFVMLSNMASKHVIPGAPTYLLPNKTIDYGHQSDSLLLEEKEFYLSDEEEQTEEKRKRHKLKTPEDRKIAWKIFDVNAERGDYSAMYWKGVYLWEEISPLNFFKLTADYGIPEAQLRYAFALKELKLLKEKEDRDEFIKYLK
ncbi:31057_t:CDS:2, partial [Racocetra persica]